MKRFKESAVTALLMLSVMMFSGCAVYTETVPATVVTYENPQWAPPSISGVRYYYLPDIECYYDLSGGVFVFLNNGQWRFSRNISYIYPDFDLNRCYTIVLDINVYRPWMHHQHYVSHYPRYYYRDYYDRCNIPYVRGYNENSRSAFFWSKNERDRAREWNDQNLRANRKFKYSDADRKVQNETTRTMNSQRGSNATSGRSAATNSSDRRGDNTTTISRQDQNNRNSRSSATNQSNESARSTNTGDAATRSTATTTTTTRESRSGRSSENTATRSSRDANSAETNRRQSDASNVATEKKDDTNYYGKTIGQPVKVERQMRNQTETPSRRSSNVTRSTTTTTSRSTSTSTGRSSATEKSTTGTSRSGRR